MKHNSLEVINADSCWDKHRQAGRENILAYIRTLFNGKGGKTELTTNSGNN